MKLRLFLSALLVAVLVSSFVTPFAAGQGPAVDRVQPGVEASKGEKAAPPGKEPEGDFPGVPRVEGIAGVGTDYVFSSSSGTYTEITGGTLHGSGTPVDDSNYNAVNLGFTFPYNGVDYTQIGINSNGFVRMGGTAFSGSCSWAPISSTDTTNCKNLVAALGEDLQGNAAGELRSELLGTAPDQVFVIQWKEFRHYAATGESYNFQIRLHEGGGVEFVYGAFTKNATARSDQVGLKGDTNTDFNNRATGPAQGWTDSVAGTLNNATMTLSQAKLPPSGLSFLWTILTGPNLGTSTKDAPARVVVGTPIEYTLTVLNTGVGPAEAATLVDPIPAGTTFVNGSLSCSSGACAYDAGTNTVSWAGQVAAPAPNALAPKPAAQWIGALPALAAAAAGTLEGAPAPKNPAAVLWDQPSDGVAGVIDQYFSDFGAGVFSGDDFVAAQPWDISTIFVDGMVYPASLPQAESLNWYIFPDAGGVPAGYPGGGGHVWSLSLPPTSPAVTISGASLDQATLDVVAATGAPVSLAAGTYWLAFYPSISFGQYGQWMWDTAGTLNGALAQVIDPTNLLGRGWTAWTPWTAINPAYHDGAFRLEGTAGGGEPQNPVVITFQVLPEGACGETVHNEATISDPAIPAPVVVTADTALVAALPDLTEGFDGELFPPAGWTETIVNDPGTDPDWSRVTAGTYPTIAPHAGAAMAKFNSYSAPNLASARLAAPAIDLSGNPEPVVGFYMSHDTVFSGSADRVQVQVSIDGGVTWVDVGAPVARYDAAYTTPGWGYHEVALTGYGGLSSVAVGLLGISAYGNNFYVDDVLVVQGCHVPAPEIDITPTSLSAALCPDEVETQQLTICNTGDAELSWEITEMEAAPRARSAALPAARAKPAQPVITDAGQCAAFENYAGVEPLGWAEHCAKGAVPAPVASFPAAPTDTGYAQDIGYVSDNFVSFALNNFSGQTVVGTNATVYYGMDFDPTGTVLWALSDTTDQLGTIDPATGAFTGLVPCAAPVDIWTGLTIDPISGDFYASTATDLYTLDPATGAYTLVGPFGTSLMIEIAMNATGQMYGHDIGTDSIYQIDPATGAATLIGLTGYDANYAQGMDFDSQDGTLYIWLYQGSGANVYGTVDLATGAVTPLSVSAPTGEFEGATQTTALPPVDIPWLSTAPITGTIPGGECQVVDVSFDAAGLAPGLYSATLRTASNDADEPAVDVPVTLEVESCGNDTIHVGGIGLRYADRGYGKFALRGRVLIQDALGGLVEGAEVAVEWTLADGQTIPQSRVTNAIGESPFKVQTWLHGTFELCVTGVVKAGWMYDPAQNVETCETVIIP